MKPAHTAVEFWQHWTFNLPVFKYAIHDTLTRSFPKQRVDHWQLIYVEDGALAMTYFEREIVIRAGEAMLLPPAHAYRMGPAPGSAAAAFQLVGMDIYALVGTRNPLPDWAPSEPVRLGRRGPFQSALTRLAALCDRSGQPVNVQAQSHARQFLDAALYHYITAAPTTAVARARPPAWLLKASDDILHKAHKSDFALRAAIAASGYSRGHFYRLFVQHLGVTPDVYACQCRMRLAVKLLTGEPQMAIGDVARACGYTGQSHFNRHFRHHLGVTPKQYRQGRRGTAARLATDKARTRRAVDATERVPRR
jgi:AraC-like DNA-binding protein